MCSPQVSCLKAISWQSQLAGELAFSRFLDNINDQRHLWERAGEWKDARCTLRYAAPEVVLAINQNTQLQASPAVDVWALAMMSYEATVGQLHFTSAQDIFNCAQGHSKYPWELPSLQQPTEWQRSRIKGVLQPCLERDPALRPSVAQLLTEFGHLGLTGMTGTHAVTL
jgi:serine/threonine protein kinase